jgi:hypothetical protein
MERGGSSLAGAPRALAAGVAGTRTAAARARQRLGRWGRTCDQRARLTGCARRGAGWRTGAGAAARAGARGRAGRGAAHRRAGRGPARGQAGRWAGHGRAALGARHTRRQASRRGPSCTGHAGRWTAGRGTASADTRTGRRARRLWSARLGRRGGQARRRAGGTRAGLEWVATGVAAGVASALARAMMAARVGCRRRPRQRRRLARRWSAACRGRGGGHRPGQDGAAAGASGRRPGAARERRHHAQRRAAHTRDQNPVGAHHRAKCSAPWRCARDLRRRPGACPALESGVAGDQHEAHQLGGKQAMLDHARGRGEPRGELARVAD